MSVTTKLRSPVKPASTTRTILGPAENIAKSPEKESTKNNKEKKTPKRSNIDTRKTNHNSISSESSGGVVSSGKKIGKRKDNNNNNDNNDGDGDGNGVAATAVADAVVGGGGGGEILGEEKVKVVVALGSVSVKRCDWITSFSDPLYCSFHDEEWGVPVHDDRKLFELFVLSIALAELTWPAILYKRDTFRKHFNNFDPSSVANFSEQKLLSVRANASTLLSEPKLRAIVENAKQLLKVQQEFGSFSNYCWKFVNHKPIRNGFRYARQVPAKTPKSELISKDLMKRGFRCVGPTVIYSYMQVSGMVNDHLITCFRHHECNDDGKNESNLTIGDTNVPSV